MNMVKCAIISVSPAIILKRNWFSKNLRDS